MVIKRSSAREVSGLLLDLETGSEVARDAATARLSVIGTRAVEGLLAMLASTPAPPTRAAALTALEAIGDPRAADQAFACLMSSEAGARGPAAGVLRRLLDSARGAEVLDRLIGLALDTGQPDGARMAALDALQGVPPAVLEPIVGRLRDDPSISVRAMVAGTSPTASTRPPLEAIEHAAEGPLPDDPAALRQWLAAEGGFAALPVLHRLVQRIREHETSLTRPDERRDWMTARAVVHQVLAARNSTVALYDLRETIESGEPAPVEMLSALATIGDRSCLEPIASAYARLSEPAGAGRDPAPWWREHLASTFQAIAARERLNERHAVVRKIRTRWPASAPMLLGPLKF